MMTEPMQCWTIYERPLDYPDHFVVREFLVSPGRVTACTECGLAKSLEEARALIPPGRIRFIEEGDSLATHAVESWI